MNLGRTMKVAVLLGIAGISFAATTAHADAIGTPGLLVGIQRNESSSDEYGASHGRIIVRETDLQMRTYRWGGSLCFGKLVTSSDVEILARAVGNRSVEIKPFYKTGSASTRCLVSFIIAEPDVIDGLGQVSP